MNRNGKLIAAASVGILALAWLAQKMYVGGFFLLVGAVLFLPKVTEWIIKLVGKKDTALLNYGLKIGIIVIGFIAGFIEADYSRNKAKELVSKADKLIEDEDIKDASTILNKAIVNYKTGKTKAYELKEQIDSLKSKSYLIESMASLSNKEYTSLGNGDEDLQFINHGKLNELFIDKLIANKNNRENYLHKKLDYAVDNSLDSFSKEIIIYISEKDFEKLKRDEFDTSFIEEYPGVNQIFLDTLQSFIEQRKTYAAKKLDAYLSDNQDRMKEVLGKMKGSQFKKLKLGTLDTNFFKSPAIDNIFISRLKDSTHLRREYHIEEAKRFDYEAYAFSKDFIKERLKSPTSAEFPNRNEVNISVVSVSISEEPRYRYRIRGYVDSKNSFGAMIRSNFSCLIDRFPDKWRLISLDIN